MSYKKKNFNRRVNQAHVSQLSKISSGEIAPTKTISLSDKGSIVFFENFFLPDKADRILNFCNELDIGVPCFKNYQNKIISQPRASIWFGPVPYSYSKFTLPNRSFSDKTIGWLELVRKDLVTVFDMDLNSCLINLYRNGLDKVEWHADNELIFGDDPTIVSLSFGVTRKFEICHIANRQRYAQHSFDLTHGSVIVMKGDMQKHWLHRVPVDRSSTGFRYNLTFRNVV